MKTNVTSLAQANEILNNSHAATGLNLFIKNSSDFYVYFYEPLQNSLVKKARKSAALSLETLATSSTVYKSILAACKIYAKECGNGFYFNATDKKAVCWKFAEWVLDGVEFLANESRK